MPRLVAPTSSVRDSYLEGERAAFADEGLDDSVLEGAEADFEAFAANRRRARVQWGVPVTELWFVDGSSYIGTVVIRHRLTPELRANGGHIGFHVVPPQRRHGYATEMLAEALEFCRRLGLPEVLITCDVTNSGSRKVIEANGGRLQRTQRGIRAYTVDLSESVSVTPPV
ncbi:MAG: GNAT family N-acetyltransferase [Actinomycetota bacterium]|nr:GNAT family N-acetyltransferase [Actinomycetota bacterium]